jgi:hypothetical protein
MTLIIGPGGTGLTFLSWSILFLRGDTVYQTLDKKIVDVNIDPLIGKVAHGFDKDHIQTPSDILKLEQAHKGSVIYFVPNHQRDFDTAVAFNCNKIVFDCQEYGPEIFTRMMTCLRSPSGLILLFNKLSAQYGQDIVRSALLEFQQLFTKYYTIPTENDFFKINYNDVFVNLDQRILDIFKFLNLSIDPTRFDQWSTIYFDYRERNLDIHKNYLESSVPVDSATKTQIFKEVIKWTNGQCHPT